MSGFDPRVFRAYDIRGNAERDLTPQLARALGSALSTFIGRQRGSRRIAVGRDCRLSSEPLWKELESGLLRAGATVIDLGVVPSPVVYFAAHHLGTDGAVVVTGSHNPPEDNGFKMMCGTATLHGADIAALLELIEGGVRDRGAGLREVIDLREDYLARVEGGLELGPHRPHVVIDAGNGAAGPLAVDLYQRLGFPVTALHCEMDGRFPNHHPDPTVEDNLEDLRATVMTEGADIGLAFDGDGDRLGAIDGRGRVLWGDQLMQLFGRDILQRRPGATFIAEVKCSQALFDGLREAGGNAIMWKVGHSLLKAKMKETGAVLAGEMSGHLFFADRYLGYDDGLYAGARLLELLSRSGDSLATMADGLPASVATPEIRIPCADDRKFDVVRRVAAAFEDDPRALEIVRIDGVRARFQRGWGLVRASNTGPVLVLRAEADSSQALKDIRAILEQAIATAQDRQSEGPS